ncbi:DUF4192 family protein [Arthrobacter sp. NPDC090010]|uniref:DUF4192 family protein n=1 Tax=Arthrobacter sp. NPDC090010 TaxID=3363942 RepID=UPI0038007C15
MERSALFTATSPEDILGYIPHALGFWPRESLVCLSLGGGSLGATLRVDLPAGEQTEQDLLRYALVVLRHLRHDHSSDGTLVAVFGGGQARTVAAAARGLLTVLADLLAKEGRPVVDAWAVGADGWTFASCGEAGARAEWTTAGGRRTGVQSLETMRDSRLAAEMVFKGSVIREHPEDGWDSSAHHPGPVEKPSRGEGPRTVLQAVPEPVTENELAGILSRWERLLKEPGRGAASEDLTDLLDGLAEPAVRDAVLVSVASDARLAFWGSVAAGVVGEGEEQRAGQALFAPSPDSLGHCLDRFGAVITGDSDEAPDWERMDRFAACLETALHGRGESTAAALTALAWIEWCRGRGTHASVLLGRALAVEPGHRLAFLLHGLVLAGRLSGWATRRSSSWSGREWRD